VFIDGNAVLAADFRHSSLNFLYALSSARTERRIKIDDLSDIDNLLEDIIDSEVYWEEGEC